MGGASTDVGEVDEDMTQSVPVAGAPVVGAVAQQSLGDQPIELGAGLSAGGSQDVFAEASMMQPCAPASGYHGSAPVENVVDPRSSGFEQPHQLPRCETIATAPGE
jgi:hypothetical protein